MTNTAAGVKPDSPFDLGNDAAFRRWAEWKRQDYPTRPDDLVVELRDPRNPSQAELDALRRRCRKANMAIYTSDLGSLADKDIPRTLGRQLGLSRLDPNMLADEDAITSLEVVAGKAGRGYIPYSNRRLLWHTDGYYNTLERRIRAFILHCVSPAAEGGVNGLFDHEMVYLQMREANPDWVAALMHPQAMTIPANTEAGAPERPAQTGPVFSLDSVAGNLHMRYTARTRSIVWRDDPMTTAAVAFVADLLAGEGVGGFSYRLGPGEGVVANNVLHSRSAFSDAPGAGAKRLLYRARYYDRIAGTDFTYKM